MGKEGIKPNDKGDYPHAKRVTSSYLTAQFQLPMKGLSAKVTRWMRQKGWESSHFRDLNRRVSVWRKK